MKIEKMIEQHKQMWAAFEKLNEKLEEKQTPYEPKDGEYFALTSEYWTAPILAISNGIVALGNNTMGSCCYTDFCGVLNLNCPFGYHFGDKLRPATPKEKQLLDDKLKEQGKRWNAEKKQIEDIPTWKVGDWFIPHKPKVNKHPSWIDEMDKYDNKPLQVQHLIKVSGCDILGNDYNFHPDWCEKTEEPKKEPQIGDMCIFWDNEKEYAVCALYGGAKHDYFMDTTGAMWQNCIPFESIKQYKKFINEEC